MAKRKAARDSKNLVLEPVDYAKIDARQRENYNFAKVAAVLADYGYVAIRVSADWAGADFIAYRPGGRTYFVQLKSRLTIDKKYEGKNLYICFPHGPAPRVWFMYYHDDMLRYMLRSGGISQRAWRKNGGQSRKGPSVQQLRHLNRSGCRLGREGSTPG